MHLASYGPEEFLHQRASAQVNQAQTEAVERLLANLERVVPVLEQSALIDFVINLIYVFHQVVIALVHSVVLVVPLGQTGGFQRLEHQNAVVRRERAAALVDDVGVLDGVLFAGIHKGIDGIVHILLNGVVHRVSAGAVARPVVVHAQTAANVHKVEFKTHLGELHIELRSLAQRILDAAYLGHLTAYVEVDELQAVHHLVLLQEVERREQFARVQTELAAVAAALLPLAAAAARELDAHTHIGPDTQLLGNIGYEFQFVGFLHHQEDSTPHLLRQQSQFHIALVLVAVADDERVGADVGHIDG